MDLETKIKIEKVLNDYFNRNYSIYNYPIELEGLKVNSGELLELIEFWDNHNSVNNYDISDYFPGERINPDEPTWEEILEESISKMEKQVKKYEKLIKKHKNKK